jgi:hypothetical protein
MDQRLVNKLQELHELVQGRPFDLARTTAVVFLPLAAVFGAVLMLVPAFYVVAAIIFSLALILLTICASIYFKGLRLIAKNCLDSLVSRLTPWLVDCALPKLESISTSRALQFRYISIWVSVILLEWIARISIGGFVEDCRDVCVRHTSTLIHLLPAWVLLLVGLLAGRIYAGRYFQKRATSLISKSAIAKLLRRSWCALMSREVTFVALIFGYFLMSILVSFQPHCLGDWFTDWLQCSLRDANLTRAADPAPSTAFVIKSILAAILFFLPLSRIWNFAAILSSAVHRGQIDPRSANLYQALVGAVGVKTRKLIIQNDRLWFRNASLTFWWVVLCYVALFACSMVWTHSLTFPVPGTQPFVGSERWLARSTNPLHMQIFLAAVCALYGTAPFAIGACAFLPNAKPSELLINSDGLLFPGAFLAQLLFRPFRTWSDIKSVKLIKRKFLGDFVEVAFHSGGRFRIRPRQLSPQDLDQLLMAIDEHADQCNFDILDEDIDRCCYDANAVDLGKIPRRQNFSHNRDIGKSDASKYRSTIFTPLAHGTTILKGSIRIVRQIASRPLSVVYLVRTKSRLAVLKEFVIPTSSPDNLTAKLAFERECKLLQSLDHPQIVKVLNVFQDGDRSYLLIEHVKGQDLFSLVCEQRVRNEELIIDWAKQLCHIMEYLHSQDPAILHRDLTPDNIVLDESGQLRLIDFGAANQFMEGVTGTLIGKQAYIAPEQLRGKATVRSDIYSFGCTLYYLVAGKEPRALAQSDPISEGILISKQLNDLIVSCTEFEEDKRPGSFKQILEMLSGSRTNDLPKNNDLSTPLAIGFKEDDSESVTISLKTKDAQKQKTLL